MTHFVAFETRLEHATSLRRFSQNNTCQRLSSLFLLSAVFLSTLVPVRRA